MKQRRLSFSGSSMRIPASAIELLCSQSLGPSEDGFMEAEEVAYKLRALKRTFDLLSRTVIPMSDGEYKAARMKII